MKQNCQTNHQPRLGSSLTILNCCLGYNEMEEKKKKQEVVVEEEEEKKKNKKCCSILGRGLEGRDFGWLSD